MRKLDEVLHSLHVAGLAALSWGGFPVPRVGGGGWSRAPWETKERQQGVCLGGEDHGELGPPCSAAWNSGSGPPSVFEPEGPAVLSETGLAQPAALPALSHLGGERGPPRQVTPLEHSSTLMAAVNTTPCPLPPSRHKPCTLARR